ncbi:unnamed protein product [Cladocopium goreaui]|uniref:5-formyltetrahydrofolate cyclo-ligase n=1 Tax=Cladocopium goreaui TaxID=2562237 RepID=A0A9P1DIX0_9DINO|nr:unnamed protein product [Cladocopium goreaui]
MAMYPRSGGERGYDSVVENPEALSAEDLQRECQQRERDGLKYDNVLKNDFKSVDVETFKNANIFENDQDIPVNNYDSDAKTEYEPESPVRAEGPEIAEDELQRWCGTVWVLQSEPTVEVQAPHAVRKALQIQPDGSLWARREASGYWMPLLPHSAAAANYRHFSSSVFPFGLCCTSADFAVSSCCSLAFDSEDEKNVAVRIFTNLFLQRLRKSTPPPAQSIPSSTRQGNRTRTSMTSISDRVRGFNRARTVTSAAMAAASRLGNRSPASFRTGSPFSRLSPTSPAQASMASVGSDEVAEAAAAAAAAAAAEPKKSMAVHVQLKGLESGKALDDAELNRQSQAVCERLLRSKIFAASSSIGIFLAMPRGELRTTPILREAFLQGKRVYCPRVLKATEDEALMEFYEVKNMEEVSTLPLSKWKIPEPPESFPRIEPWDLDLLLVPAVALDLARRRCGQGMGFYDRYIQRARQGAERGRLRTIGVALTEQLCEEVPSEAHDELLDAVTPLMKQRKQRTRGPERELRVLRRSTTGVTGPEKMVLEQLRVICITGPENFVLTRAAWHGTLSASPRTVLIPPAPPAEVVKTAQDAILEDDNRELGILVVASGEGDTGNSVQVNVEHFAAVCVPLNSCWWPDVSIEEPFPEPSGRLPWPELRLLPEAAPSGEGQGIMSSFGPLEVWMQSEVPSPLTSPARPVDLRSPGSKSSSVGPMVRPARPVPSALHDLEARSSGGTTASLLKAPQSPLERLVSEDNKKTALQCLARGEAVEGQLVETRALQMMLLWEPDKLIGIRLESVFVNELMNHGLFQLAMLSPGS